MMDGWMDEYPLSAGLVFNFWVTLEGKSLCLCVFINVFFDKKLIEKAKPLSAE